jgi:hypothetical protein
VTLTAGQLLLWAKNNAPNDLFIRDDTNTDRKVVTAPVPAADLADAIISPAKLATVASNIGVPFSIGPIALTATGAAADDVVVYSANAPFAFRIRRMIPIITTGQASGVIQARNATGGGGAAVSSEFDATVASDQPAVTTNLGLTATIALNGTLVVRRNNGNIAGEVFFDCVRI